VSSPSWRVHARSTSPGLLLLAAACAHPWLERTMARHMGIELPALFLVGWIAGSSIGDRLMRALAPWNAHGLPVFVLALFTMGFWMIPAALDAAVLHGSMATLKVLTVGTAGLLLRTSWSSAEAGVQGFFVLNWFWMTLAAGLLYQDAAQQLCSVYLVDQQGPAGQAMVIWALIGLGAWLRRVALSTSHADDASLSEPTTAFRGSQASPPTTSTASS
jgi:hypothetical protein